MINSQGHNAGSNGWTHDFVIHMFNQQKPGTIPVAVGHANSESGITNFFLLFIIYFRIGSIWDFDFLCFLFF